MSFERQQVGLFVSGGIRRHIPLYIRLSPTDLRKSVVRDRIHGGLADKKPPRAFKMSDVKAGAKVEREHSDDPAIQREITRDHLTEDKDYYRKLAKMEAKKAIEGQQEVSAQIGSHDPMYSTHKPDMHVEAAKHYIQADYHSRQPGGQALAEHHNRQFGELQRRGAQPKAQHFQTAMHQLHPKFSQAMKSNPKLYIKE
jgi:hypothetical protein